MTDERLSSIQISIGYGRTRTMAELVAGWDLHVTRLARETIEPFTEATWGAHDYFAALSLRDFIERGASAQDSAVQRVVEKLTGDVDRIFSDFTEPDAVGLVIRFGEVDPAAGAWWWRRIPRHGLVRDELETWWSQASARSREIDEP